MSEQAKILPSKNLLIKYPIFFEYKGKIIWDNSKPDGTPKNY